MPITKIARSLMTNSTWKLPREERSKMSRPKRSRRLQESLRDPNLNTDRTPLRSRPPKPVAVPLAPPRFGNPTTADFTKRRDQKLEEK
jgi:hypothetical protein